MKGVLFVVMPFGALDSPQIGVSTMQAQLRAEGTPCDIAYLNLLFASWIGLDLYSWIGLSAGEAFTGEWLFSRCLFSHTPPDDAGYLREVFARSMPAELTGPVQRVAGMCQPFLDHCMRIVDWDRYDLV
ncbi:MAG TPA: hypothetical protein VFI08_06045, partial [Spirochaetia bacterium]|nr:hypothetical protein [Spirochaetia bacterium]